MHGPEELGPANSDGASNVPWWKLLNRYHWFVLMVAALGWLFDTMDQQLFVLARPAAVEDLVPDTSATDQKELGLMRKRAGDIATSVFIAGWACGGLFFGMLGDRIGRARTMLITILMYSLFTGLSSISIGVLPTRVCARKLRSGAMARGFAKSSTKRSTRYVLPARKTSPSGDASRRPITPGRSGVPIIRSLPATSRRP